MFQSLQKKFLVFIVALAVTIILTLILFKFNRTDSQAIR